MARKVTPLAEAAELAQEPAPTPKTFQVNYDDEAGTVSFEMADGTPVLLKKPKTRQLLLMQSWLSSAPDEYKTNAFMVFKLASLCTAKYGKKKELTFDELLDLELEDAERMAKALECFRDFFEQLQRRVSDTGAEPAGNDA